MTEPIRGIHHITAIAAAPQRNLDFYTRLLGLRLVKLTVNFDDPGTYHFYFGDRSGQPGTILTFFPWGDIRPGQTGTGQVSVVSFQVPAGSIGFWSDRLKRYQVATLPVVERFGAQVLPFADLDGLPLELVAAETAAEAVQPWTDSEIPAGHALAGFAPPTLLLEGFEQTAALLTEVFGMHPAGQEGSRFRFSGEAVPGGLLDLEVRPDEPRGRMGAGVVHHIAFRARDDAEQMAYRQQLVARRLDVTPVLDRQYFHSIYFREPGGILFEIATDPPGFLLDETPESLGTSLRLPPWMEPNRARIEAALPPLKLPEAHSDAG